MTIAEPSTPVQHEAEHGDHPPFIAHHFEDANHQFESGKLGMWIFLVTEILFFSGMFCAYAVYRSMHPEIFSYAAQFLDSKLGGINTVVLICSSLTAAWSVRCAQLGQRKGLILTLALTIIGAFGFLGIKYVEYSHKFHDGLLPGKYYQVQSESVADVGLAPSVTGAEGDAATTEADSGAAGAHAAVEDEHAGSHAPAEGPEPDNVKIFFGIYFAMTGVHGLHVIIGIGVYIWLLFRAIRGDFRPDYYGPVDFTALYWHLVDLIWIFLFPLLYLIH